MGPAHYPDVSFDFASTDQAITVGRGDGTIVKKELDAWIVFYSGSAIPSWSRYNVILTVERKLYVSYSDDSPMDPPEYRELHIEAADLQEIATAIGQIEKDTVNGTYSDLSIMDGSGWTLIVFPDEIYVECTNHYPESAPCLRLVELLKKYHPQTNKQRCFSYGE